MPFTARREQLMGNGRGVVVDIHGRCENDFWGV